MKLEIEKLEEALAILSATREVPGSNPAARAEFLIIFLDSTNLFRTNVGRLHTL